MNDEKKETRMNIDDMTVAQVRELSVLINGGSKRKTTPQLEEKRVILVVDRGWIFAGDQTMTSDGYVRLTNAVHVFRWESIGFAKMIEDWKSSKVDLRKVADVEVPKASVVFRVPVPDGWGNK